MILGTVVLGTTSASLGSVPTVETPTPPIPVVTPTSGGGYPITSPSRNSSALLNRDYREREAPKRVTRFNATATADGVVVHAVVGVARARGAVSTPPVEKLFTQDATSRADTVRAAARLGRSDRVNAIARTGKRSMSADEWFLLGFTAGQD